MSAPGAGVGAAGFVQKREPPFRIQNRWESPRSIIAILKASQKAIVKVLL